MSSHPVLSMTKQSCCLLLELVQMRDPLQGSIDRTLPEVPVAYLASRRYLDALSLQSQPLLLGSQGVLEGDLAHGVDHAVPRQAVPAGLGVEDPDHLPGSPRASGQGRYLAVSGDLALGYRGDNLDYPVGEGGGHDPRV